MAYALKIKSPDTNRFRKIDTFKNKSAATKSINKNLKGLPKKYIKIELVKNKKRL